MNDTFNPWLEIWTRPRATIRRIVSENPNRSLWWLAAIYGFGSLLNNAQSMTLGNSFGLLAIFLVSIVFAALWGYLFFSIWSGVVHWVGKLFQGQGTFQEVRSAYAWSCVPLVVNVLLWFLLGGVFGLQLFSSSAGGGAALNNAQVFLLFFVLIARLVLAIWSLVIYFNALAEVQKYSILKSILNVVIAGILLFAAVWVLWTIGIRLIHPGAMVPSMFWSEGFSLPQTFLESL